MKFYIDKLIIKVYTKFRKLNEEVNRLSIIMFDYSKLRGRIREKCGTNSKFAAELGCSDNTLSAKLNHLSEFDQSEIVKSINILDLSVKDIPTYFFTKAV